MLLYPKSRSLSSKSFSRDLSKFRPKEMKHLDNIAKSCIFWLSAPFWPKLCPILNFPVPHTYTKICITMAYNFSGKKSTNSNVAFKSYVQQSQFWDYFCPFAFGPKKWKMGIFIKKQKTLLSYHFLPSTSCQISIKNNERFPRSLTHGRMHGPEFIGRPGEPIKGLLLAHHQYENEYKVIQYFDYSRNCVVPDTHPHIYGYYPWFEIP